MSTPSLSKKPRVVFDVGNVLLRFSKKRVRKNFGRREPGASPALARAGMCFTGRTSLLKTLAGEGVR